MIEPVKQFTPGTWVAVHQPGTGLHQKIGGVIGVSKDGGYLVKVADIGTFRLYSFELERYEPAKTAREALEDADTTIAAQRREIADLKKTILEVRAIASKSLITMGSRISIIKKIIKDSGVGL